MDLNELQNDVDRDLKIDDTELDLESIRTPQLHNKYLKLYTKYSLQLKKAQDDYKILYRSKWEYYTGKADPDVYREKPFDLKILKADVAIYLDSDKEIQELGQKEAYIQAVVTYLEKILREINNRNWTIRNTIEWKKFIHGE
jgi:hypothetical protein|tara:strand:+ start:105 stop:530 length:426 start_codon:yes stop_codon:yes gene_type:complete